MNKNFNDIELTLKKYNQEHILNFYSELDDIQKEDLIRQIHEIDLKKINSLYNNSKIDKAINLKDISPIEYIDKEELNTEQKELCKKQE